MKEKTKKQRIITVALVTAALLIAGVIYALLALNGLLSIPCFIKAVTGFECPGCGISRTFLAIVTLRFDKVFSYNLMWPVIVFYLLWIYVFAVRSYIRKGVPTYDTPTIIVDIATLAVMLVWWIVRNIAGI